jgi:hypothetical protein
MANGVYPLEEVDDDDDDEEADRVKGITDRGIDRTQFSDERYMCCGD